MTAEQRERQAHAIAALPVEKRVVAILALLDRAEHAEKAVRDAADEVCYLVADLAGETA